MPWLRVLCLTVLMTSTAFARRDGVNAVIGDESYIARFGVAPDARIDEDLRLRVHLAYVEQLLRARTPAVFDDARRAARARNLDLLHAYIERGEFPRNHTFAGRRPHFIDEDGRICAVGYLIEQTAGRAAAEAVNAAHEWDYLDEIDGIEAWVAASGLTVEELAMIQPSYGWRPRPEPGPSPRPVPPRPPPPDERAIQQRIVVMALARSERDVRQCAIRFEAWSSRVTVAVTIGRARSVMIDVGRAGGAAFQRCVRAVVGAQLASSRLTIPITASRTFALRGRFAQPPPAIRPHA